MADKQDPVKPETEAAEPLVAADDVATVDECASTEAKPEDSAAANDPATVLQAQVEDLEAQLAEAKEQALRAAAEMQNVRKRSERDVENAHKYGQEKLISSLLPVLDNLDRALDAAVKSEGQGATAGPGESNAETAARGEALQALLEGIELTRKSAYDVLRQFSVEVLEPYGEPFDPQLHEAMTMIPSDTAEPNSVIDVLQKGYRLHGRLLRAAMVVVAKS